MDWISCRKRNFYNSVKIRNTSGRCPSIILATLGSVQRRHSATWIRSGNISCWPTDAVLHGHCILNSTVRSEVFLINSNYTLCTLAVQREHSASGIQKSRSNEETKPKSFDLCSVALAPNLIKTTQVRTFCRKSSKIP